MKKPLEYYGHASRIVGATYALILGGALLTYVCIAFFSDIVRIAQRWISWIAFSIFMM